MQYVPNVLFAILLIIGIGYFTRNIGRLRRNILLGKSAEVNDNKPQRWKNMMRIALGQTKMVVRPIPGILHIIVYVGFVIINIEVLEIIIDGLLGTHRVFSGLGKLYNFLIGSFEILALLVIIAVVVFWVRRNVIRLKRFLKPEMTGWPKKDGNLILYIEVVLMVLFLTMNAADFQLQQLGSEHYIKAGAFPVSGVIAALFQGISEANLIIVERAAWWLHISGILFFLNYLYYSKHLHILLAFPNTYYGKLTAKGHFKNLEAVTNEVKLMMDPSADPFAAPAEDAPIPEKFGASDVKDLDWVQLLNA